MTGSSEFQAWPEPSGVSLFFMWTSCNEPEKNLNTRIIIFILCFYNFSMTGMDVKNKFRNPYEDKKPKKVGRLAQLSKRNRIMRNRSLAGLRQFDRYANELSFMLA